MISDMVESKKSGTCPAPDCPFQTSSPPRDKGDPTPSERNKTSKMKRREETKKLEEEINKLDML
jgi:hypothetical protein